MAANRQTDIHTHTYVQCRHASVGLAQARPNYVGVCSYYSRVVSALLECPW